LASMATPKERKEERRGREERVSCPEKNGKGFSLSTFSCREKRKKEKRFSRENVVKKTR